MILLAGGSGRVGRELASRLAASGIGVRVLTRDAARARQHVPPAVEVAQADVRTPIAAELLENVDSVISAMTGFGVGGDGVRAVDYEANVNLIRAAERAHVRRFVLFSMRGAAPGHWMELLRMKYAAEQALVASTLDWTVIRPTVFAELWADIIGTPIVKSGRAFVFGRGDNPVNFVSVQDLAAVVGTVVGTDSWSRCTVEAGGAENLTLNEVVELVERFSRRQAKIRRVPVPALKVGAAALRPFRRDVAGLVEAGISMARGDMTFDATELRQQFPDLPITGMSEVVRRIFEREAHAHADRRQHDTGHSSERKEGQLV